jgi:hypothetical protein
MKFKDVTEAIQVNRNLARSVLPEVHAMFPKYLVTLEQVEMVIVAHKRGITQPYDLWEQFSQQDAQILFDFIVERL